jgi:hypothetical protein
LQENGVQDSAVLAADPVEAARDGVATAVVQLERGLVVVVDDNGHQLSQPRGSALADQGGEQRSAASSQYWRPQSCLVGADCFNVIVVDRT